MQVVVQFTGEAILPMPAPPPLSQKSGTFIKTRVGKRLTSCCFVASVLDLFDPQSV